MKKHFEERQALVMAMLTLGTLSEVLGHVQNHVHMTIEYEIHNVEEDNENDS